MESRVFCIQHAIKISQNTKDFNLIHCDILTTTNTGLFSFRVGIHSFMSIKYQGSNVKEIILAFDNSGIQS